MFGENNRVKTFAIECYVVSLPKDKKCRIVEIIRPENRFGDKTFVVKSIFHHRCRKNKIVALWGIINRDLPKLKVQIDNLMTQQTIL